MLFKISRTSNWNSDIKPCDEAFEKMIMRHDVRTISSPNDFDLPNQIKEWYENGLNHRVESGQIVRDFPEKIWVIKLKTLNDLMKFVDTYDSIIITDNEIEIYDDYRE